MHAINRDKNIWPVIVEFFKLIDSCGVRVMNKCLTIDKIQFALYVTWIWAIVGLYIAKAFQYFFIQLLKLPNNLLWIENLILIEQSMTLYELIYVNLFPLKLLYIY